jgi:hypothetical protein
MKGSKPRALLLAIILSLFLVLTLAAPVAATGDNEPDDSATEVEETAAENREAGDLEVEEVLPEAEETLPVVEETIPGAEESSVPHLVTEATASRYLSSISQINYDGFDGILLLCDNFYSFSMVNFEGTIYVGTWNLRERLYSLYDLFILLFDPSVSHQDMSNGAEIWRYEGGLLGRTWDKVVDGGLGDRYNMGVREMTVWDDPDDSPDRGPAIFATTYNAKHGCEIWRSFNGTSWEVVVGRGADLGPGFGFGDGNDSGRALAAMGDYVYAGVMRANGGQIWRSANGSDWEYVTSCQDLERSSFWINFIGSMAMSDMRLFDDDNDGVEELFVGTWRLFGFSVYRYDPDTNKWSNVAMYGIKNWSTSGVSKLVPFNGRLWILTINYLQGFDVYASNPTNPAAGIRSNADWELVATKGFNDVGNYYSWSGIVYPVGSNGEELSNSRLFIGSFCLDRGFYLYSVTKSGEWAIEASRGYDNPNNYGVRSMSILDGYLILGTAGMVTGTQVYRAH